MNTIQNKERFIVQFMFPGNEFILKEEAYYEDTHRMTSMGGSVKPVGFSFKYDYEKTPNAFRYGSGVYPSKFIGRSSVLLNPVQNLTIGQMKEILFIGYRLNAFNVNLRCELNQIEFDFHHGDEMQSGAIDLNQGYVLDYLRQNGFATEWMGLSVEEQIEYGWIKLKEVKPVLYPLEYLTKEIEHEGEKFVPQNKLRHLDLEWLINSDKLIMKTNYEDVLKLLEWHFNVFQLPEDQFINKATLTNK